VWDRILSKAFDETKVGELNLFGKEKKYPIFKNRYFYLLVIKAKLIAFRIVMLQGTFLTIS